MMNDVIFFNNNNTKFI